MSIHSQIIKKDIDSFQGYVQKLSIKIQSVSMQWNDENFFSLTEGIFSIAQQSKEVLITGDKFCESVDKFYEIANEDYG